MFGLRTLSSEPDWKAFYQRKYDDYIAELYDFTEEIMMRPSKINLDEVKV